VNGSKGFTFSYPAKIPKIAEARSASCAANSSSTANYSTWKARAPMDSVFHTLELLRLLLVSLIPVVIAIACVGGAWLSGRALKP